MFHAYGAGVYRALCLWTNSELSSDSERSKSESAIAPNELRADIDEEADPLVSGAPGYDTIGLLEFRTLKL